MASVLANTIEFFHKFGMFDIVLLPNLKSKNLYSCYYFKIDIK